jgi:two-component system, NarL family, sensor histidine kinase UhpB
MTALGGWAQSPPPYLVFQGLLVLLALLAVLATLAGWLMARRQARTSELNRALAQEAARHAAIIASAADAVISVDARQRVVLFNPAAESLFGCPAIEALGGSIARFIPTELHERHAALVGAFAASPETRVAMGAGREVCAERADGRRIPVEIAVSKVVESDLPPERQLYTVVVRDISQRKAAEAEMHRLSERYRLIVEQSPDAIWLSESGRLQFVNEACVALLGARSPGDLCGRELSEFLPDWRRDTAAMPDAQDAPARSELRVRRLDGGEREVELSVAEVPDHDGRVIQGVMRDISARKRVLSELERTQASLIETQRIARVGHFSLDVAAACWTTSPLLLELIGQPEGTRVRQGDEERVIHPDDRAAFRSHLKDEVLSGRRPFDLEFRIVRGDDGQVRWLHGLARTQTDAAGRVTYLVGSVQDVTERRLATQALEHSREELRRLSASLTHAREEERRHVARDLHDELGQRLSALKLDVAALLAQPAARDGATGERLRAVLAAVDGAVAATRRIAAHLRPAMLDDLGLNAALEWLVADWTKRAQLEIELHCEPVDDSFGEAATTAIYRIVQEGLTNVTRHAHANRARVELRSDGGELLVGIEDDGRGLAPGDTDKRSSAGLAGIRERARILDGSATIRNRVEGGCRLEVRLPLERVKRSTAEAQEP